MGRDGLIRASAQNAQEAEREKEDDIGDGVNREIQQNRGRLQLVRCGNPADILPMRMTDKVTEGKNAGEQDDDAPGIPED